MNLLLMPQTTSSTDVRPVQPDGAPLVAVVGDDAVAPHADTAFAAIVDAQVLLDQQPKVAAINLLLADGDAAEAAVIIDEAPDLIGIEVETPTEVKVKATEGESGQFRPVLLPDTSQSVISRPEAKSKNDRVDLPVPLQRGTVVAERTALPAERPAAAAASQQVSTAQTVVQGQITARQADVDALSKVSGQKQTDASLEAKIVRSGTIAVAATPNGPVQVPQAAALSAATVKQGDPDLRKKDPNIQLSPAAVRFDDAPKAKKEPVASAGSSSAVAPTLPAQVTAVVDAKADHVRHVIAEQDVAPLVTTSERPATAQASTPLQPATATETARQVAHQIANAVNNGTNKTTEIALNPEELGRVRLSLSVGDGAVALVILAERPETQDLMRRHIETLAQEFRDLGYEDITFSFDSNDQSDGAAGNANGQPDHEKLNNLQDEAVAAAVQSGGLDLRL